MYVSVIVVAFDEERRIESTVRAIQDHLRDAGHRHQIVVAADGTDRTRDIARRMASTDDTIVVAGTRERRGKGRSIREAIASCDGDVVGFVDGDGKTAVDHVGAVLAKFDEGPDVVIGSRRLPGAATVQRLRLHRRIGSWGFARLTHLIVGLDDIPDTQCGCKFFRHRAAQDVFRLQSENGYIFDVEVLAISRRLGLEIAQVPVTSIHDHDSRSRPIAEALDHVAALVRIRRSVHGIAPPTQW